MTELEDWIITRETEFEWLKDMLNDFETPIDDSSENWLIILGQMDSILQCSAEINRLRD